MTCDTVEAMTQHFRTNGLPPFVWDIVTSKFGRGTTSRRGKVGLED
jgi:hypothetical protein